MGRELLSEAIEKLQSEFLKLDWTYHDLNLGIRKEKIYKWPGDPEEDIIICVHKSNGQPELFHRHDFFYFNYTYMGTYESLSYKYDNKITIREKELYAGQPFAGHALCVHDNQETIIIGVVIQKEVFFRSFMSILSSNSRLFHFFLDTSTKNYTEEYLHFKVEDDCNIRTLLEMMIIEYANKQDDTQQVLKSLVLSFLLQVARQYNRIDSLPISDKLSDRIVRYIGERFDSVTLKDLSKKFHYHPNYISNLLTREIGKSFSQILLEQRMARAVVFLKNTSLTIEEIAYMLGYGNSSNFYKAFKEYYHMSPRNYAASERK